MTIESLSAEENIAIVDIKSVYLQQIAEASTDDREMLELKIRINELETELEVANIVIERLRGNAHIKIDAIEKKIKDQQTEIALNRNSIVKQGQKILDLQKKVYDEH